MSSRGPAPSAAMLPVEKLEADRVRKSKTLDKAIERTTLIKEEMAPGDFPALEGKASYVSQLYAHKATADEDVAPSTRTLAERIKLRKEKAHQDTVVSLEAKRLDLEQRAKRNDEEAAKLAGKLTGKKKISLADALANDKRLEAMQPGEVLREFVAEGERAPKTLEQYLAQRDHIKRQAIDSPRADTTDGGSEAGTSHTGTESARESPCANEESVDAGAVGSKMHRTAEVLRQLRQKQDAPGGPQKPTLDKLVKAIKHDLPEQEQAIHELRMKKAVFASRLEWAKQRRPDSQMRHEIGMGFTAKARQMKEVCGQLVTDIIDLAMKRIEMRPTAEQVAAEVHQWRVSKLPALMGIARHLADAVMKDVVDELIAEVSAETSGLEKASSQFAFNLLVEAVAFSHGKYDFERFDVHSELRKLRRAEEKVLAEALGQKAQMAELRAVNKAERARAGALTAEPQARSLASGGSGRRKRASSTGSAGASGAVGIEGEDELDLARPSQEVQGWDDDSEEEEDEWAGERGGLRPSLLYHQVVDAEELAALNVDDPFGVLNQRLQRLLPQRRERFGGDSSGRGVGGGAEDDLFEETAMYMAH
ncbi:hypothetical protein FOA52_004377 [Chlamydomonas sp. UWO 241]|nr:hypothetical protein FOA52_004377 [Chlamydomonas sp. UWO 241]